MPIWNAYPATYRQREVLAIAAAARAGECTAVAGLSGSGKSNLLGFIANRLGKAGELPGITSPHPWFVLIDCNRLVEPTLDGTLTLLLQALEENQQTNGTPYQALELAVQHCLEQTPGLCLLLDRFDSLQGANFSLIASNLRALRDSFKYDLSFVIAARRAPEIQSELAELFYAHTLWLGPLTAEDAAWSVELYRSRQGLAWEENTARQMIELSWGYPSFLRAACEAYASGCALDIDNLRSHPAVQQRVTEFLADQPGEAELQASRLSGHPFLPCAPAPVRLDPAQLTAKEYLLWQYLQRHSGEVCEKDDLVHAVWPEDRIFERGVRDDSLAQLVRRLREKVECEPSSPEHIHTVPGRGYRYTI
jgi:energy-coupling factor transporter ATP-binding protein EcfA2